MTESNLSPLPSRRLVGDDIRPLVRVRHHDYGDGHIAAVLPTGVQIYWNTPYASGLVDHLLLHDRSWVAMLERLPEDERQGVEW